MTEALTCLTVSTGLIHLSKIQVPAPDSKDDLRAVCSILLDRASDTARAAVI